MRQKYDFQNLKDLDYQEDEENEKNEKDEEVQEDKKR